jgi:8-oxo-dGTP diphosphatase
MKNTARNSAPILAAGGVVVRDGGTPRIAVVKLRKDKSWVLPKGKLKPGENALAAAKREVTEETGHKVEVREFLGSLSHATEDRHKIVQFWHMRAVGGPVRKLEADIKDVKWLTLRQAIKTLSRPQEQVFLANVGPIALRAAATVKPIATSAKPPQVQPPEPATAQAEPPAALPVVVELPPAPITASESRISPTQLPVRIDAAQVRPRPTNTQPISTKKASGHWKRRRSRSSSCARTARARRNSSPSPTGRMSRRCRASPVRIRGASITCRAMRNS